MGQYPNTTSSSSSTLHSIPCCSRSSALLFVGQSERHGWRLCAPTVCLFTRRNGCVAARQAWRMQDHTVDVLFVPAPRADADSPAHSRLSALRLHCSPHCCVMQWVRLACEVLQIWPSLSVRRRYNSQCGAELLPTTSMLPSWLPYLQGYHLQNTEPRRRLVNPARAAEWLAGVHLTRTC